MVRKVGKLKDTSFYYDDREGFGMLGEMGLEVPIYVDDGSDIFSTQVSLKIVHTAFLHILGHDPKHGVVYSRFSNTLTSFIASDPIIQNYFVPARCSNADRIISTFVPDQYRSFLRNMIEFIMYLHDNELSLRTLSLEKNFAVLGSNLKIHSLKFSKSFSEDTRKNDFNYLHSVLTKLFPTVVPTNQPTNPPQPTPSKPPTNPPQPTPLPVPRDIQHLLNLLENYSESSSGLVECHLAILTSKERITAVRNFWERRKFMGGDAHLYLECLEEVGSVYEIGGRPCGDWIVYMDSSPQNLGPIKDCYFNVDKKTGVHHSSYSHNGTIWNMNEVLVKFCRHLSTHVAEHMLSYRRWSSTITVWEVDQIVMALFDEFLLALQVQLHSKQILKYFI